MRVELAVNGQGVVLEGHPMERLLDLLREQLSLPGTKEGCGEGECGACTVLLDGEPVLACLVPLLQCGGRRVDTIEGIAHGPARALVDSLVAAGGVQCGACTPGIVVTAWALFERSPAPTREEIAQALAGNLCRCTGYEGIFRALLGGGGAKTSDLAETGGERRGRGETGSEGSGRGETGAEAGGEAAAPGSLPPQAAR